MEIPHVIVMIICGIGFLLALSNFAIINRQEIPTLNWKVKETFYALSSLAAILVVKSVTMIWLKDFDRYIDLLIVCYILVFNAVLLKNVLMAVDRLKFCKDCVNIPFYIAVLWLIFEEKVSIPTLIIDISLAVSALAISAVLIKLLQYIKLLNMIVVPVNMRPSLLTYLVFMMFYLASVMAYGTRVYGCMLAVSMGIAVASMILLELELRKIKG